MGITELESMVHQQQTLLMGQQARLDKLESASSHPSDFGRAVQFQAVVLQMSKTLFGDSASIQAECDAETNTPFLLVSVLNPSDENLALKLNHHWHEQLVIVAGELAPNFCLAMIQL